MQLIYKHLKHITPDTKAKRRKVGEYFIVDNFFISAYQQTNPVIAV